MARHFELGPIALAVIKRNTPDTAELVSESVSANIFMEIK
jgi:hypothetical protein